MVHISWDVSVSKPSNLKSHKREMMEDEFRVRLGRIRDKHTQREFPLQKRIRNLANKSKYQNGYQTRYARGRLAALESKLHIQKTDNIYRRRVLIKTHIAKPSKHLGRSGFKIHLKYLQREGVDKDGIGGELYSSERTVVSEENFLARSAHDRHQFRFILSAEDSNDLLDMKQITRKLMAQVEKDLGAKLDWLGVDHYNTEHPHSHIVLRGKDKSGRDLVIAREYLSHGMRLRAEDLITKELGLRSDREIFESKKLEITKDCFTRLDRDIENRIRNGGVIDQFDGPLRLKFEHAFVRQRLQYLQSQNLADFTEGEWKLKSDWQEVLRARGKRGDLVRSFVHQHDRDSVDQALNFIEERQGNWTTLLGAVVKQGLVDELQDQRYIIIEDQNAQRWHMALGKSQTTIHPSNGAIVRVEKKSLEPKPSDIKIDQIAKRNVGRYSDQMHCEFEPGDSIAYRLAIKRRLEGLRRKGIVDLVGKDVWKIPTDYLTRISTLESKPIDQAKLSVKSWMPLDKQITANGYTWLDSQKDVLKGRFAEAKEKRIVYLRQKGWLKGKEVELSDTSQRLLRNQETKRVLAIEINQSKRNPIDLVSGGSIFGRYEKSLYLAKGRMALIGNAHQFAIVPWRPALERHLGREMLFEMGRRNISWKLGKEQDLGR
ncbi:DUF3363 domain-containing protein [Hirschia litorea]|uniref:DUF3363 domain-containing protein n=1 Tax=Hirschia litorea TaxID=1199156 RepID=A0ABW2IPY8_9PROT